MKKLLLLIALVSAVIATSNAASLSNVKITPLEVSDVKWVYLKFDSDVKYADRGTDDIKIEVTAIPSIVRIKSEVAVFERTTVTFITLDGIVHTFALQYSQSPSGIAYLVKSDGLKLRDVYHLELSHKQTSHIVFPVKVVDVASGSDKVIVMKTEEIENIVKCKTLTEGFDYFEESSLTVISEDGEIYPFLVRYKENPELVNVQVEGGKKLDAIFSSMSINEPEMKVLGEEVLKQGGIIRNLGCWRDKMAFSLYGIYVKEDVMMFYLRIDNLSKVDYEIDFIKSYIINNKKTTKKQAYQADEKFPLYTFVEPQTEVVRAGENQSRIFFFKRFTIPRKHSLHFELFERNGGRHLKFTVSNKVLLEAKTLKAKSLK